MEEVQFKIPSPEAHLVTDADRIDGLRKLAGYVENGSDTTVSIFQYDATKSWMVRVGKSWPSHGSSLREDIDAALAAEGSANGV